MSKPEYKILYDKNEFEWYKKKLDAEREYDHLHLNEPKKYPCGIRSDFYDDPNSPYTYYHYFYYQQEVICKECDHKGLIWPHEEE